MSIRTPKYRLHKGSGQALVQINGQRIYLGTYGSEGSKENYRRLVAQYLQSSEPPRPHSASCNDLTINELFVAYWEFATRYYVKNGRPTDEQAGIRMAVRPLQRLYGHSQAGSFGPSALKVVRQAMIEAGHSRLYINKNVNRIRRMFGWTTSEELLPSHVYHALQSVPGLKVGRTEARETQPVAAASPEQIEAVMPYVSRQIAAMIQLQRVTGARPGEIVLLRPTDVCRLCGRVWVYTPQSHKSEHHGRRRQIHIGPVGQAVLREWLDRDPGAYCFSPREAAREFHLGRRASRRTPMTPSQAKRRRERSPKRSPGERYSTQSYGRAILKACKRTGVEPWSPNQLRHTAGTSLRKQFGIEAARVILGHGSASVTEVYAELDHAKAAEIMAQVG